jgi:deoxyuridine 5'-triphosphate nucleotidohydrolase
VNTIKWTGDEMCAPIRHYSGDAGFDLIVSETVYVPVGDFMDIPLGISVELPPGVWAMLTGRSSTLRRRGLLVTMGIIDNGYRGPLYAGCQNVSREGQRIGRGERIAQLIPYRLESSGLDLEQVYALGESDRGANSFGSTGT